MSERKRRNLTGDVSATRRRSQTSRDEGTSSSSSSSSNISTDNSSDDHDRPLTLYDLVSNLPESTVTMLSRTPAILCDGDIEMASWRDLKEIFFPRCSGKDCTIVENALKLKLQYPRNMEDIRVCSSKEQMEFLNYLHLVAPGTLLVNVQTFSRHLPALLMMVTAKHHVSQDIRSLECMYVNNCNATQNDSPLYSPTPTPREPFTVTEIHFPVIKLPGLSSSPEEDDPETKSTASRLSSETNINSLSSKCVPMRALLMARSRKHQRVTKLPQYFIPLRNVLEVYPGLQHQLMKVCADFVCQYPTQALLKRCTVEEARELSSDPTSGMYLTSSDLLVQWTDPFYLMICLQNRNLKPIREERTIDTKNQDDACATSSESYFEFHPESLSDCSDSQYDADIEETVDQSTSDDVLTAIHNRSIMEKQMRSEKRMKNSRSICSKDSRTSLADQDEDMNCDSQLSSARSVESRVEAEKHNSLAKQDSLSDDGFDPEIMRCFPPVEKMVYDPEMIAIQLRREEEKLKRQRQMDKEYRQDLDEDSQQNRRDGDDNGRHSRWEMDRDCSQRVWNLDKDSRQVNEEDGVFELASLNNTPRGDRTFDSEETVIADLSVEGDNSFIEEEGKCSADVSPSESPIAVRGNSVNALRHVSEASDHCSRSSSSVSEIEIISDQGKKRSASKRRLPLKKNSTSEEISKRNVFDFLNEMTSHRFEVETLVHRNQSPEDLCSLELTEIQMGRESEDPDRRSQLSTIRSSVRSDNAQISTREEIGVERVSELRQESHLSPSALSAADDTSQSPLGNRLSTSENPSPLYSSTYEANDQLSLSCSRSATDVTKQTPRSKSAKRGQRKSRGSWYDDSEVPKLYKVLSASEVARRSAELVAVELSRRKSGMKTDSETNLLNSPLKRRKPSSTFKQSFSQSKRSTWTSLGKSPDQLPALRKSSVTPRKSEGSRCLFMSTPTKSEDDVSGPQNVMRYGRKSWQSRSVSRTPPSENDVSGPQSKQRTNQALPLLKSDPFSTEFFDDVTSPNQTVKQTSGKSVSSKSESPLFKRNVYLPKIESNQQQSTKKTGKKPVRSSSRLSQSSGTMVSNDANSVSYQTPKRTDRKSVSVYIPTESQFENTASLSDVRTTPQETPRTSAKKSFYTNNTLEWGNVIPCSSDEFNQTRETGRKSKRSIQFSKTETNVSHSSAQTGRKSFKATVRTPQSWTSKSPSWTGRKSVQIWASSFVHHSENALHSNSRNGCKDQSENQMEKPGHGKSPELHISDVSQSETAVSDEETSLQNYFRRVTRSRTAIESYQSESVQKYTEKTDRRSVLPSADAEQAADAVLPATDADSYSNKGLNDESSHSGQNDRKSQGISGSSDSELTERQTGLSDCKLYPQSGFQSARATPRDCDRQSESSLSPKSAHSDDRRPLLEVILSSKYTLQKTPSSSSQSTEVSGRISKENMSCDSDDGVKQPVFSAYDAVQLLNIEVEKTKHATEIFHTLLKDEIQFVVELAMQNALNEKMNRIYDGRNQDDNTIVSYNRSKYNNIYKNIADKTFDKTDGSNVQNSACGRVDGKDSKKNKNTGKQVVTPIRIRKTHQQDQSTKSVKWTVEKMSKDQSGKKSTKKQKKNVYVKEKSSVKSGCSNDEKKGNSQHEAKPGDKMESSSWTCHGKQRTVKADGSGKLGSECDKIDKNPDGGPSSGSNSRSLTNRHMERDSKYVGSSSNSTQVVHKQQDGRNPDSHESQIKDGKSYTHGQKNSQSSLNQTQKEQRPKIGKLGYNDSSSRQLQNNNTSSVLKNSCKTSGKADDTHQTDCTKSKTDRQGYNKTTSRYPQNNRPYRQNSLPSNLAESKTTAETKQSQNTGIVDHGYEFSGYFTNESESRVLSGSGDGKLVGDNRRTVMSEEMLNEMVSSNPFAQSVESLKSLNNCCVIKQLPCDTRRVTRQMTYDTGQGTRRSTYDTGGDTSCSAHLTYEKKQERKNVQASSGSEQVKKQATNESGQAKRYPGEIDIVAQLLSTAIPDKKKKSTSPSFSRSVTVIPAPQGVGSQMTMSAESLTPPNVTLPVNPHMRVGIGLAPAGYSPMVDSMVMNQHMAGSSTCYAVTVQSASSVYFSSPQGSHFMNTGTHSGLCGPRLQGPLGRDMHSTPIPFPPPMPFGDSPQCFVEQPVYGTWFVSNSYPPPGRLTPTADDSPSFTPYRPFHGYRSTKPFRKTFDDAGPYLFPMKQKQKPVVSIVSEYSIPMMQTAQRNKDHRMQHRDSYSGKATQLSGEQKHVQTGRQKIFGDISRSSPNLLSSQSKNSHMGMTSLSMRCSRSDSEDLSYGNRYDRRTRTRTSEGSSGLRTINSEPSRIFTQACKACGKGSHYYNKRDPRLSEAAKNKYNSGHCRSCSEKPSSQSKSESDTCGKSDANNNSISEDHLDSKNLQRVAKISSKNCIVTDADADADDVENESAEVENKLTKKKKSGEQETCQTDNGQSQKTDTSGFLCNTTVHGKPGEQKAVKQYLKMKVSLTSENCPVHSDNTVQPNQQEITSQGEVPAISKQQKQVANSLEEKAKTPMRRRFRTVKDRILESVRHLQEANSADCSNGTLQDDTQVIGLSIQLCPRNPSEGCSVCTDSCSNVNQESASATAAGKSEKNKQRKRSKRPAKTRKNFTECQQKMLQGAKPVEDTLSKEQDILLKLVTDKQSCKNQGHIDESDLRIGDANGGPQLCKGERHTEKGNSETDGSDEGKNKVVRHCSKECNPSDKVDVSNRREDSKTNDQVTVGVSGDSTSGCSRVSKAEQSSRRQDVKSDDRSKPESAAKSNVNESERRAVRNINQIRYRPISSKNKSDLSVRGLALYKDFVFPYVTENGYKYIPIKDAHKLFELCCPECSISRSLLRKDPSLTRTLCNWEQACLFDEIGMSTVQPISTGDVLLRFDKLVQELPRLEKIAREKHRGTKLKKSQNCRYF